MSRSHDAGIGQSSSQTRQDIPSTSSPFRRHEPRTSGILHSLKQLFIACVSPNAAGSESPTPRRRAPLPPIEPRRHELSTIAQWRQKLDTLAVPGLERELTRFKGWLEHYAARLTNAKWQGRFGAIVDEMCARHDGEQQPFRNTLWLHFRDPGEEDLEPVSVHGLLLALRMDWRISRDPEAYNTVREHARELVKRLHPDDSLQVAVVGLKQARIFEAYCRAVYDQTRPIFEKYRPMLEEAGDADQPSKSYLDTITEIKTAREAELDRPMEMLARSTIGANCCFLVYSGVYEGLGKNWPVLYAAVVAHVLLEGPLLLGAALVDGTQLAVLWFIVAVGSFTAAVTVVVKCRAMLSL